MRSSGAPGSVEARLSERAETASSRESSEAISDAETSDETVQAEEEATVEVDQTNEMISKNERAERLTKIREDYGKHKTFASDAGLAVNGLGQSAGAVPQAVGTARSATENKRAEVLKALNEAVTNNLQQNSKFYGDIQTAINAAAQSIDLVNQTVVASSRV